MQCNQDDPRRPESGPNGGAGGVATTRSSASFAEGKEDTLNFNVSQKLMRAHLVDGQGHEVAQRIDLSLTQDATGTPVMLKLDAMALDRVRTDPTHPERATSTRESSGHAIVTGRNYGQGSSREHASAAPRFSGRSDRNGSPAPRVHSAPDRAPETRGISLICRSGPRGPMRLVAAAGAATAPCRSVPDLRVVLTRGSTRIPWMGLVSFEVLPLVVEDPADYDALETGDVLSISGLRDGLESGERIDVPLPAKGLLFLPLHDLS